jgi:hypothetical protein
MNFRSKWASQLDAQASQAEQVAAQVREIELEQALTNFRASVKAWSEAELSRSRMAVKAVGQRRWRLAAGWALGCALLAGGAGGGVYEHHQRVETARVAAAARAAEQQRLVAAERARDAEEDLLAKVDKDVSQEVPSAMEPLARLMDEAK